MIISPPRVFYLDLIERARIALREEKNTDNLVRMVKKQSTEVITKITQELPMLVVQNPKMFYEIIKHFTKSEERKVFVVGHLINNVETVEGFDAHLKVELVK